MSTSPPTSTQQETFHPTRGATVDDVISGIDVRPHSEIRETTGQGVLQQTGDRNRTTGTGLA